MKKGYALLLCVGCAAFSVRTLSQNLTYANLRAYADDLPSPVRGGDTLSAAEGEWISFWLEHDGWPATPTFKWFKDGLLLDRATYSGYQVDEAGASDAGSYHVVITVGAKSITTAAITLRLLPGLIVRPTPTDPAVLGATVTLAAEVPGVNNLSEFLWRWEQGPIPGATNASLPLGTVSFNTPTRYGVSAFYPALGRRASADYELRIYPMLTAPVIVTQPQDQIGRLGGIAAFTVGSAGATPFSYQWQKNGVNLTNRTNFCLLLGNLQPSDAANYTVVVRNAGGAATSSTAKLTLATPPAPNGQAAALIVAGRAALAQQTPVALGTAKTNFLLALDLDANDPLANLLAGITRIFDLASQPAANALLDRLLVAKTNRNLYDWQAKPARDANGDLVTPPGVNANELPAFLRDQLLPELRAALTNLNRIKDASFTADLTRRETTTADVTVDEGDLYVVRAGLLLTEYLVRTVNSWNLSAQLTALRALMTRDQLTVQQLLTDYPQLLTFADANQAGPARAALEAAVDAYVQAAGLILNRPAGTHRLFDVDSDDRDKEEEIRQAMLDLKASLSQAIVLNAEPEWLINFGRLADGTRSPRSLLPDFIENDPDSATLPDPTLGGAFRMLGNPKILLPPVDRSAAPGSRVTLGVVALGADPLGYQWSFNGSALPGATSPNLPIASLGTANVGAYRVVVSNQYGTTQSESSRLTIVNPLPRTEVVWLEDALPAGVVVNEYGGEDWIWVERDPLPLSGRLAHRSASASGLHLHYFSGLANPLPVGTEDNLVAYIYLDATNPPKMAMLQWLDETGSWEHRAYWGQDLFPYGQDIPTARRPLGALPAPGQWARLEVPARAVGLDGHALAGIGFVLFDGAATWDRAGKSVPASDLAWLDDALPANVLGQGSGGDDWTWTASNPAPQSGTLAHLSKSATGLHQHYFEGGPAWPVGPDDSLFTFIYLDPANPPAMVLLQWLAGTWEHRAYWGENRFSQAVPTAVSGTPGLRPMGPLPAPGVWMRLSVPAGLVELENQTVNGIAFTLFGGQAAWDHTGKAVPGAAVVAPRLQSPQRLPGGEFRVLLVGQPGRDYTLERSSDLRTWQSVTTARYSDVPVLLADPQASGSNRRFYRARLQP